MAEGDRGASLGGTPHAPNIDPRSVTTAGQTLSPEVGRSARDGYTWGPIPIMSSGMTFREVGSSGLRQFSGWIREEFLQVLTGRQAAQKYREMMDNSPTIGALLFAIQSLMRKVEWRVQPGEEKGASQEGADFLESCMQDMSHTWSDFVGEALSMLPFGFAPMEICYKKRLGRDPGPDPDNPKEDLPTSEYDDGKIGWRRLPLRGQDTVIKWFFDVNGITKGLTQQPWVGPLIDIPIEKLLLLRPIHYKANPEGRSILRNSYVPWYYAKRMQEQEAILSERLAGIPVIYVPGQLMDAAAAGDPNATASLNMYKKIAINTRIDEQMGIVLPSDTYPGANGPSAAPQYKFELITPNMRTAGLDFNTTITRYNLSIMTSVLADFLTLGHEARGTQSLAVSKIDLFFQAVEAYLNSIAAVLNRYAVARLWKLNGWDADSKPTIEPDMAQRVDLDVLSNFILRLSQAGMPMFPNEDLQSYILDAGGLPDIQDDRALQAAGLSDDQLELEDQRQQAQVDRLQNPPPPPTPPQPGNPPAGGQTNLEKMILASAARRQIRLSGPKFNIDTKKRHRHR